METGDETPAFGPADIPGGYSGGLRCAFGAVDIALRSPVRQNGSPSAASAFLRMTYNLPASANQETAGRTFLLRLLLRGAACSIAVLIGFLCLFAAFWLRFNQAYKGIACLCACFLAYMLCPVFQEMGQSGDFWRLAEQFCYYSISLCILWIHGQICEFPHNLRYSICVAAGALCLGVPLLASSAAPADAPLFLYGHILTAYNWLAAIYLLAGSAWAFRRVKAPAIPLMAGFCLCAAALAADCIYQPYRSVLSRAYLRTAGFIIILSAVWLLAHDTLRLCNKNLLLREQSRITEYQLAVQQKQCADQAEYVKTTRAELHEYRNRLSVIRHYLDAGEQGRMREYLDGLLLNNSRLSPPAAYTGHPLVNAVLHAQLARAEESGIYMELDLAGISDTLAVADGDIASLLMNLTDNAVEACLRIPDKDSRWIILSMLCTQDDNGRDRLQICCSNSAIPGRWGMRTAKSDKKAHGHGLDVMRGIAGAYGGSLDVEENEENFTATIRMHPNPNYTPEIL